MSIKKGNKRITITLDQEHFKRFEEIKKIFNVKNNTLAFKKLIDLKTYALKEMKEKNENRN